MPKAKVPNTKLNLYLIKNRFDSYDSIVRPGVENVEVELRGELIGALFTKTTALKTPKWVRFFDGALEPSVGKALKTKTSSGVFLFKVRDRVFALAFGYGRSILKPDVWEKRFGLKVVLNKIGNNKLRIVDRKNFDTMLTHTITQMNRECAISDFDLDLRQILLKGVTGKPEDINFANSFTGADGLNINCRVSLASLREKCESILEAFQSTQYRDKFPGVDSINEIKDQGVLVELNNELIERVKTADTESVYLAVPELLDLTEYEGFAFSRNADPKPDLFLEDFVATVRDLNNIDVDSLKRRRVFLIHAVTEYKEDRWRAYDCINCEIKRTGQDYILSEGKWYEIETSFVNSVNEELKTIPISPIVFTAGIDEKEPVFVRRIQSEEPTNLVLCDRKNISYGGGHSSIEFCDIFTSKREIIHFKRYSGSSVLSHLFSQGVVSATAFISDTAFRLKLNDVLPETHAVPVDDFNFNPRDFEVVFGIISKTAKDLPNTLPFFSKVALLAAKREIANILKLGISVARIQTTV